MSESQHKADDLHPTVETVLNTVDFDALVDELEGRSGFRVSKPDANGLTQYVWRHARFHGGYDTSIPVTASWWLQE
jgi:hypothetical protein